MTEKVRSRLVTSWLALLTAGFAWVALAAATPERKLAEFDEINVQRINIVEPDGKPRVIISNRARMAGLYWGGKEYKHHTRDEGGLASRASSSWTRPARSSSASARSDG